MWFSRTHARTRACACTRTRLASTQLRSLRFTHPFSYWISVKSFNTFAPVRVVRGLRACEQKGGAEQERGVRCGMGTCGTASQQTSGGKGDQQLRPAFPWVCCCLAVAARRLGLPAHQIGAAVSVQHSPGVALMSQRVISLSSHETILRRSPNNAGPVQDTRYAQTESISCVQSRPPRGQTMAASGSVDQSTAAS